MDDKKFKILFGKNLKQLRVVKGLSQEALAEKIGIEIHNLSRIETGRSFPRLKTLIKILNVLNIEPIELFNFTKGIEEFDVRFSINKILDKNPQKIEDFHKLLLALI
jgi:transcriptional regulator with XRE-family HTH domain